MLPWTSITRAVVIVSGLYLSAAGCVAWAQSFPARQPRTTEREPQTLLESLFSFRSSDDGDPQSSEPDRLDPDRPHFPEASTTVGKDRAVLESGYTFTKKGTSLLSH